MTRRSGAGRAGRAGRRDVPVVAALMLLIVVTALLAIACGDGRATSAVASPLAATGSPGTSADSGPKPTPWPGNAVLGIGALGAADGSILAAINDLKRGIDTEDLALIRQASDGLAGLGILLPNMDKINIYAPMVPFAERYGAAIRGIVAAATAVRSAIDAKDANAITKTTGELITSLGAYADVQPELADWYQQSIAQQRLLVR